jgi:hypothetical protein
MHAGGAGDHGAHIIMGLVCMQVARVIMGLNSGCCSFPVNVFPMRQVCQQNKRSIFNQPRDPFKHGFICSNLLFMLSFIVIPIGVPAKGPGRGKF